MPDWLDIIAVVSLFAGVVSSLVIIVDILAGRRQHMAIMNLVWPITALYVGPVALWAYYKVGRLATRERHAIARKRGGDPTGKKKPFWQSVSLAATHCGSGCTLGDLVAEWFVFFVPLTLLGKALFATWALDYVLAFLFGIAFQYYTIKPMRGLSAKQGLIAALKADTLTLSAWQVGMYGWMALVIFVIFKEELPKTDPVFWFMMQIAMFAGFLTSYPVNAWLMRRGIKETM